MSPKLLNSACAKNTVAWGFNFGVIFGAFGEVLAVDLTKCHVETSREVDLWIFSVASSEIFSPNLTKCPKIG